jgi:hypothetical protein
MPEPHDLPRPMTALGDAVLADDARVEALSADVASRVGPMFREMSDAELLRLARRWVIAALREARGETH